MTEAEKKTKGHWPKGKRRNPDAGNWSRTLLALKSLIDNHYKRDSITHAHLARACGVPRKTIWRWVTGMDRPVEEMQEAVAAWVAEKRAEAKKPR